MKETIYTIPVSEVFEPKEGCPVCRLRDMLEDKSLDAVMGAAMMEPDIRIKTNEKGFCSRHFDRMFAQKNRLSLALMLESHLAQLHDELFLKKTPLFSKTDPRVERSKEVMESCYICEKVENNLLRIVDTMFSLWKKEESFRKLYAEQEVLCLEHYYLLASLAPQKLTKKETPAFLQVTAQLTQQYLHKLCKDVSGFCRLFDYRSASQSEIDPKIRDSVERAIWFLTSRKPQ